MRTDWLGSIVEQKAHKQMEQIEQQGRALLDLGYQISDLTIVQYTDDRELAWHVWPKSLVQYGHDKVQPHCVGSVTATATVTNEATERKPAMCANDLLLLLTIYRCRQTIAQIPGLPSTAPAHRDSVNRLSKLGLILFDSCGFWVVTGKGIMYVEKLLSLICEYPTPTPTVPKWTKEMPRISGFYWHRTSLFPPAVMEVRVGVQKSEVRDWSDDKWIELKGTDHEWAGPLNQPTE